MDANELRSPFVQSTEVRSQYLEGQSRMKKGGWRLIQRSNGKYLAYTNYSKSKALLMILEKHFAFTQTHKHTLKHFFKGNT